MTSVFVSRDSGFLDTDFHGFFLGFSTLGVALFGVLRFGVSIGAKPRFPAREQGQTLANSEISIIRESSRMR